ncbi:MAG TPA: aminoacyl-tRNA hydrolase, partial [Thermodesulfobacteriota bacterium]
MILVAGLGNPGKEYSSSRHNVGFMVIDELEKRLGVSL